MPQIDDLGAHLLDAVRGAREELVLCAPFAKLGVITRVLDVVASDVQITLITRWRPEEVAAGVSDTAVLPAVKERGGHVFLCNRLHAKFVRADARVLIGSANLTATALGWTATPNLELLTEIPRDTIQVRELEERLATDVIEATEQLAAEIEAAAALLPRAVFEVEVIEADQSEGQTQLWYPALREPRDLFVAYDAGVERFTSASARAAATDLAALELPPGLNEEAFRAVVRARVLQSPIVQTIDDLLESSQRFGAVRAVIQERLELTREEADFAWQTLMRWLLEFFPDRYDRRVGNWSEVLERKDRGES